ncbi:MAG: response regulator [Thermodesulfobacteriota bacterium]
MKGRSKVLLIDDDESMRFMLSHVLAKDDYDVFPVEDGEKGIQLLSENRFDAVITDLDMPCFSGFDVIQTVRSRGQFIPIIVITGDYSSESEEKALRFGANNYLRKPFKIDSIRSALSKAVSQVE